MKFSTPLFLFLFCATVFTSCKEDEPCDTTPQPASNFDGFIQYIPYKTGDVLVFYNTLTKDTITYEGGTLSNNPVIIEDGDPLNGCLRYYEGKQYKMRFVAKNGQIVEVAYGHLYDWAVEDLLINFRHPERVSVKYNQVLLRLPKVKYSDSLAIGSNMYYSVSFFKTTFGQGTDKYYCYYSNQTGILKLEIADNETLELITKK